MIVADSSALIALSTCDALELVIKIFGQLNVPPAVFDEVVIGDLSQAEKLRYFLKDKVIVLQNNSSFLHTGSLDKGELEAMCLYFQMEAKFLLVDDLKARKIARLNQVNIIGSIGTLILAKEKGFIRKVKPFLNKLEKSPIYISKNLISHALKLCEES